MIAGLRFTNRMLVVLMLSTMMMVEVHSSNNEATPGRNVNSKPHILLIVADDLGWNDVSWHNPDVVTPNLKELALGGVILNRSYVLPICTPTRSALLTGRYPFTIGRQRSTIRPSEPVGLTLNATLLPQALKKAGYTTHAVGKWHLGFCSWSYTPTYRGFDTFYGYYNGAENYYTHMRSNLKDPPDNRLPLSPNQIDDQRLYLDLRNNTEPDPTKDGIYSSYLFASYIENLLESRNSSEPMFLYLPFQSVHAPIMVPSNYTKHYKYIHDFDRRTYLGMVTALDEAVGRVVQALKTTGHYNNSVIVFTTDNGGTCHHGGNNWPLRGMKATLWEGGTRGASFVHSPLLPNPGTVSNKLLHATDWFQTLAGLGGGVAPPDTDGYDQWEAITGISPSPRKRMVYNIDHTEKLRASVRIGNYKLIVGFPGEGDWTPPPELFNREEEEEEEEETGKYVDFHSLPPTMMYTSGYHKENTHQNEVLVHLSPDGSHDVPVADWRSNQIEELVASHPDEITLTNSFERESHKGSNKEHPHLLDTKLPLINSFGDGSDEINLTGCNDSVTWDYLQANYFVDDAWLRPYPQHLDLLKNKTEIRLYNVKDDPEERNNIAEKKIHKVKMLLEFLFDEIVNRYVPADVKDQVPRANPKHFNNTWSPGWCEAE